MNMPMMTCPDGCQCEACKEDRAAESLALDAARWRALMSCPRIRLYGCAGVDPETGRRSEDSYVHFGADFWSDKAVDGEQSGERVTAMGKRCLTALADAIISLQPQT